MPRRPQLALVVAIVLLALVMRGPIVAVSPVVDRIQSGLGIGPATVGLLTSLPVLCFALGTPLVTVVIARAGIARGVLAALGVLGVGVVLRSVGGLGGALAGTVLIGLGITLANVAAPVFIGDRLAGRRDAVLGIYTAALNLGSMIVLSATVPLADATSWRWALASSVLLVALAAVVWGRTVRGPDLAPAAADPHPDVRPWWRRPLVWLLTVAFCGQSFGYYALTAWLPSVLTDELGLSRAAAGPASGVFQICALVGALAVPALLTRTTPAVVAVLTAGCWLAGPVGLLLLPAGWPVWCAIGGIGQGAGLTLVFALVVRIARDTADSRRTSAVVQGGGYLVAATGPTVLGALHTAAGGWTAPLLVVAGGLVVFGACAWAVARNPAVAPGR